MSYPVPVCSACGRAAFPPRALCPHCDGREWSTREVDTGTLGELTERDGTRIASVRLACGPVLIARLDADAAPGASVALRSNDGVPVATPL